MDDAKLRRVVLTGAAAALGILLLWLVGKYLVVCLAPFIIAYLISLAVRPAASFISRRFGVGRRFVSVFIVIILIAAIFLIVSWLISVLLREAQDAASGLMKILSSEDNFLKRAIEGLDGIKEKIPFLSSAGASEKESAYGVVSSVLYDSLSGIASFAASAATSVIGKLPGVVFAVVSTVIATFYICTDKGAIGKELEEAAGDFSKKIASFRRRLNRVLSSYLKGYLLMMLITFSELFLGFVVLGVKNALLIALTVAIIDLLPVLGSGAVLVPWALVELFITGNTDLGVGLLILVAVMYLIRQFAEPRVIGKMMGIHPLLSLAAAYVGFVTFGFVGVLVFPILACLIKGIANDKKTSGDG